MPVGRNEPCPCGSGKKYKKCCLAQDEGKALQSSEHSVPRAAPFSGAMGDPTKPDGSLRRKIMDFSRDIDRDGKHFRRARREWEGGGKLDYSGPDGGPNFFALMDHYVHDHVLAGKGKTMLDLFHEACGRNLPAAEREMLESWLANWKACYEVEELRPGVEVRLRDLLTDRRYKVYSAGTSRQLARWDVLYARLMKLGDGWEMTGTAQMIPRQHKDRAVAYLKSEFEAARKAAPETTLESYLKTSGLKIRRFIEDIEQADLGAITTASGELVIPVEAVFDVEDSLAVQRGLDAMKDFECVGEADDSLGGLRYDWLRRGPSLHATFGAERKPMGALRLLTEWVPGLGRKGVPVLGNLTLTGKELRASCLAQERMDALVALLEERLGAYLRFRLSRRTPVEALKGKTKPSTPDRREGLPPEVKAKAMRQFLDDYFQGWKDTPLPALGGLTPRQAAKDTAHRPALDEILKFMENNEERQKRAGQVVYGAARLRSELGV